MITMINDTNVSIAGEIHSISWIDSHKSFCTKEFLEQHSPEAQTEYLKAELEKGTKIYMLTDGIPVGIVSVHKNLIENLYILPEHQKKGYGQKLLHFAMKQCNNVPTLWILHNNEIAYNMYTKNGFKKTGKENMITDTLYELEMQYTSNK